ncbi:hypothetical protein EMIHUDRAFT_217052 [Emiliania huxleyi CCMP1516]|uniref:Uncharacterized protein n=2 Tax=Emiliania huxleyi TaxID=2903 RepID=A0A0D3IC11_EMIH1|nr:hypothetical protein EMIHUDRAFT_217052 [Emiliania huxleyi CCMP1516]EOD08796.1 hypothetical protein EMIHUDRAFT_217052 [Emiliania huxleyi CCMP1516]|eukprot:XP_005761225.1 hypothetical protein EMIHUDRAFT_217052 [Emiliania huxleyi CCMP1516]
MLASDGEPKELGEIGRAETFHLEQAGRLAPKPTRQPGPPPCLAATAFGTEGTTPSRGNSGLGSKFSSTADTGML